jgi:hypothetical protein
MKLTTTLGAAGALALGAVGAMSALGGHANAAPTPPVVPFVNAGNVLNPTPPADAPVIPPAQASVPDADNAQSGDQSTPDPAGQGAASETADISEAGPTPESSGASGDGSGGHQDSGANGDHPFAGNE